MISGLGVLASLLSALRQLKDDIGILSINDVSNSHPVLSYFLYFRNDEVYWSVVDLCDQFMLQYFEAGCVHSLR